MFAEKTLADIRPEFVEDSAEAAVGEGNGAAAHGQSETAVTGGIIKVGQSARRESAEHILKVK